MAEAPIARPATAVPSPGATKRLREALRCPLCGAQGLRPDPEPAESSGQPWSFHGALRCQAGHMVPVAEGVPDFIGESHELRITPFQRVMQFPPVVAVYERYWRRVGFFVASQWSVDAAIAAVMELCEPSRRSVVVDLGCGPGNYTRAVVRAGAELVVGVDLSPQMLRRAVRESPRAGFGYMRASSMSLPFADASLDAAVCAGALHLFEDPDQAMSEVARTLVPGGVFVGQTLVRPTGSAQRAMAAILDRYVRFGFFESPENLRNRLERAGLRPDGGERRGISQLFRAVKP